MISFKFKQQLGEFNLEADAEFPSAGITVLFGKSGCGKSSLLRLIAGLDCCKSGSLRFNDEIIQNTELFQKAWQRGIGYVSQQPALFLHLSVLENLNYASNRSHQTELNWSFDKIVEQFGIKDLLHKRPSNLSGGEQQRVVIARAILSNPRCLLLDEPVTGLDEESKFELLNNLKQFTEDNELAVLYVSHDRREVAQIAKYLLLMEKGKIVASGDYSSFPSLATDLKLNFAHGSDVLSFLPVKVGKESKDHLTELHYQTVEATQVLWVRGRGLVGGAELRLQIPANEVSLSLKKIEHTSILNSLKVSIVEVYDESNGQHLLKLKTASNVILARLTSRSVERLGLTKGVDCYANFKAVAMSL